ncbi:MAG: glycosyltransferase family 4 protein [Candidatus Thorarchaeota archaeon]
MRILHTSHTGLPDYRIEKTAMTMQKEGHDVIFLGGLPDRGQSLSVFNEYYHIPIVNTLRLVLDSRFKKKWIKKIDEIKPDVVHAHNIIAAAMMLDTEYPVVYDDHEYWSKQIFRFHNRNAFRRIARIPFERMIPKWEMQIKKRYPILATCETTAKEHREIARYVGVTRNFPTLSDAGQIKNSIERTGSVYIGADFDIPKFAPHRDMTGLREILEFQTLSGLTHSILMERLTHFRFGLTPWLPHPSHRYSEPNKHYEYLIAGLQVIVTSSLMHPFKNEPYVHSFQTYDEIPDLISQIEEIDSEKIMIHSKNRYVWEKQEETIKSIYKKI